MLIKGSLRFVAGEPVRILPSRRHLRQHMFTSLHTFLRYPHLYHAHPKMRPKSHPKLRTNEA